MKDDSVFYSIVWTTYFLTYVKSQFSICFEGHESLLLNDNFLAKINHYRKQHQVDELILDPQLMSDAKGWSKHMALEDVFEHSKSNNEYGENIWVAFNTAVFDTTTMDPIAVWYNEIKNYKFGNVKHKSNTANFTQLVWKSTVIMGCGMCMSSDSVFLTCRFSPPGNIESEYTENVFRLKHYGRQKNILISLLLISILAILILTIYLYKYFVLIDAQQPESTENKMMN